MANNKNVKQQVYNVSIPKKAILEIAQNEDFKKKDLRVLLTLFTVLEGWTPSLNRNTTDPENFTRVDIRAIADSLNLSRSDVEKSIETLYDAGIIEEGENDSIAHGYRFRF